MADRKAKKGVLWSTRTNPSTYDANYPVYSPGKNSLKLMEEDLRWFVDTARLSWPEKLAVIANDALNNHSRDLGVDGRFFVSLETIRNRALLGRFGQSGPVPLDDLYRFLNGPCLFFAPYRRTDDEKAHWRASTLAQKITQQTMAGKSQHICESWPVLPIWTGGRDMPKQDALPIQRQTAFPSQSLRAEILADLNIADTSLNPKTYKMQGLLVDCFLSRALGRCRHIPVEMRPNVVERLGVT